MSWTLRLSLVLCGVLACVAETIAGVRVIIVGDGSVVARLADVRDKVLGGLPGTGNTVDTFNNDGSGVPSLALLKTYDVAVVYSDTGLDDGVALGNVLADYVDAGGNVVEMSFSYSTGAIGVSGRWASGGYRAMSSASQTNTSAGLGVRAVPSHPILAGVSTFSGTFRNVGTPNAGVYTIASWTDGNPLVMTVPGKNGRIASLNFYPPSNAVGAGFWDQNTDGARLMANACTWAAAGRVDVLILGSPSTSVWTTDVRQSLLRFGRVNGRVDIVNIQSSTPTAETLRGYDSVLVFTDASPQDPTLLGNRLADYVDAGGGVVAAAFSNFTGTGLAGRVVQSGYLPFTQGSTASGTALTLGAIAVPGHPILDGVTSLSSGSSGLHVDCSVRSGATLVASWSNGRPLVATSRPSLGKVVGLNLYPPSSNARADFWAASTDGGALLGNAIVWSARNDVDLLVLANLSDPRTNDVVSKILADGRINGTVSTASTAGPAPSLPFLARFDAVLTWTSGTTGEPSLLGDVLSYYNDAGGGVVDAVYAGASGGIAGRWISGHYSGILPGSVRLGAASLGEVLLANHPVARFVSRFEGGFQSPRLVGTPRAGTTEIARWSDGLPLAVEHSARGFGRVVSLNFFPPSSDTEAGLWNPTSDGLRLLTNSIDHVARGDAAVLIAGTVAPAGLADLRHRLLATGRLGDRVDVLALAQGGALPPGRASAYDTVLVGLESPANAALLGDQLADFVDSGGGVVTMGWAHAGAPLGLGGRWINGGYSPFAVGTGTFSAAGARLGSVQRPGHPVLAGVASFGAGEAAIVDATAVAPDADAIADYDRPFPLVAEIKRGPLQSVAINGFLLPGSSSQQGWDISTHGATLIVNALDYVSSPRECRADFNGDGFADFFDFDDFVSCFEGGPCPRGRTADFNGDGFADFFDYDDFVRQFEQGC